MIYWTEQHGRFRTLERKRAFTLIEVLVVVAIVAVLLGILLPVFLRAKEQAKASVCLSNFKQVTLSTLIYASDYDDRYALAKYSTNADATSAEDRTWVQLVLPYGREFAVFKCPSDYTERPDSQAVFDTDLVPGDTYSRYYTASKHTNLGYNYLYLSPLIMQNRSVLALSRSQTDVADPGNMLLFGDSVHEVVNGNPQGGGSYLIIPPCRRYNGSFPNDSFRFNNLPNDAFYTESQEWETDPGGSNGEAVVTNAGGLWPWHVDHLSAIFVDGHARHITLDQAVVGCNVKPNWAGRIFDPAAYIWDLE